MGGKVTDQQVRKLMEENNKKQSISFAAMKAGMNRRTAKKYLELGKLPSELPPADRTWRTRTNPFEKHWSEVEQWLNNAPEFEAKFLFEQLCEKYPGIYQEGQVRTFQRHVKQWRATEGPDKEVFFSQKHYPGKLMQTDFTHMNSLKVTIQGEEFNHMICHCVLTYSNWEWGRVCFSESYEAIKLGIQSALVKLGRVPKRHRTDGTSAATHSPRKGINQKREFNETYKALMSHFDMKPEMISDPNHNADVEALNNVLKKRVNQHLLFRGNRDFKNREEYEKFIFEIMEKANSLRSKRLKEEFDVMKELPVTLLPLYTETKEKVRKSSTIVIKRNVYSVPSRLIGEEVTVRIFEDMIHIFYINKLQMQIERLKGCGRKCINYRHIVWSLMRKPGAFENFKYREELFPTIHFRKAFDAFRGWYSPFIANKEYVQTLYFAATTMESEVESALILLIEEGTIFSSNHVKDLICIDKKQVIPKMETPKVNLADYNILLQEKEEM